MPANGMRWDAGSLVGLGTSGYYWSSREVHTTFGYYLMFNSTSSVPVTEYPKFYTLTIRCVRKSNVWIFFLACCRRSLFY